MGTIAQELTRIQNAKSDLKTAIEAKGVTVPSATTIDGYATLVGQIQTGATEAPENDVNFYDYDGFRVASYTIEEAKALTQAEYNAILPPTHEGLTFEEWNWTLNDIITYDRRYIDIGANYIPTDRKTHLKCKIETEDLDTFIYMWFGAGTLDVDWGDESTHFNSTKTTFAGLRITHTYATQGEYEIIIGFTRSDSTGRYGPIYHNGTQDYWKRNLQIYEWNCGEYLTFQYNSGLGYTTDMLLSISKTTYFDNVSFFGNSFYKNITIPRGVSFAGVVCLYSTIKLCYPKEVTELGGTNFGAYFRDITQRRILPEYTSGTPHTVAMGQLYRIVSIPASFNIPLTSSFCESDTMIVDVPQGYVPLVDLNFSGSQQFTADAIMDVFNKLGTISTTRTLTWGASNLNRLSADQKAIATNKGYTLA